MNYFVKSVVLLLPLCMTACSSLGSRKVAEVPEQPQKTAPAAQEPPPKPVQPPAEPLPPVMSVPKPVVTVEATKPQRKKPAHKSAVSKPVETAASTVPPPASDGGTPAVSALGQLSPGDSSDLYRQTSYSIAETEKRLNGINRKLSDSERRTADNLREYIKQAKTALAAGDVDGASTLAAKAKVLLAELGS